MTHAHRDWIDIFQALLTPTIAVGGLAIGIAQWWIARNKFKLDLFDRRWVVWEATAKIISAMFAHAAVSNEDKDKFLRDIRGAKWLFNSRIEIYLKKQLWPQICALDAVNMMLQDSAPPAGREAAAKKKGEIMEWTVEQYDVIEVLFDEYMQMDTPFIHWLRLRCAAIKTKFWG